MPSSVNPDTLVYLRPANALKCIPPPQRDAKHFLQPKRYLQILWQPFLTLSPGSHTSNLKIRFAPQRLINMQPYSMTPVSPSHGAMSVGLTHLLCKPSVCLFCCNIASMINTCDSVFACLLTDSHLLGLHKHCVQVSSLPEPTYNKFFTLWQLLTHVW